MFFILHLWRLFILHLWRWTFDFGRWTFHLGVGRFGFGVGRFHVGFMYGRQWRWRWRWMFGFGVGRFGFYCVFDVSVGRLALGIVCFTL